jgi:hypothetical protein
MTAPFEAGADHETPSDPLDAKTETDVGAPGAPAGVTDTGVEGLELPAALVAVTVIA